MQSAKKAITVLSTLISAQAADHVLMYVLLKQLQQADTLVIVLERVGT